MIDGVLQLDFPRSAAPSAAAVSAQPFMIGAENSLLAPPILRLLGGAAVADKDLSAAATQFNPLVLVGPSGSGKSHIAQGLVRAWTARLDAGAVAYFTAADFGRERQAAEAEERLDEWRTQLRAAKLLVIDDVDRLRPRATIQRELRQSLDAIVSAGGVVLVTAMREPLLLKSLDSSLRDRLVAGLTVRVERPGLTARRAILAQAAAARGLSLDPAQLDQLAKKDCATPAQLLGRLAKLQNSSAPLSLMERGGGRGEEPGYTLHPSPQPSPPGRGGRSGEKDHPAALKQILAIAARYFGLTQSAITGKSRRTSLVEARNIIVHIARRTTDLSYAEIGRALGGRDHTTIMHAERRLAVRLSTDPNTQQAVDELERLLA